MECAIATLLLALCVAQPAVTADAATHDPLLFEAAFQGRCGAGSPCEQLCRELHDGTYECGCKPGFLLNVDGYSCQELNTTTGIYDFPQDVEEDVLYQKDATFSAELDVALLPSNQHYRPEPKLPNDTDVYTLIEDNHIYRPKHINDRVTELPINISEENITFTGKKYKQMEGLNNLISEGVSRKDINMITDEKTRLDDEDDVKEPTTQGPSLEQKVPGATSSPRWTTAVGSGGDEGCACGAGRCGNSARCLCPLGRTGSQCQHEARISSPRFGGDSWLALPALRGAYKRVRLRVRVRPERARGVLLLTGERDDLTGDYLALVLKDGHVEMRFDCGSGAGILRSPGPVHLGRWNTIYVYRHRWDARLRLNTGPRVRGRSKGLFSRMTFREPVWVGGGGNTTGLSQKLTMQDGLVGCVDFLRINGQTYRLVQDALAGADVAECAPSLPSWQPNEITTTSEIKSIHAQNIERSDDDPKHDNVPKRASTVFSGHDVVTDNIRSNKEDYHESNNVNAKLEEGGRRKSDAHFNTDDQYPYKDDAHYVNELTNSLPSEFGSLKYVETDTILRDVDHKYSKEIPDKVYTNKDKFDNDINLLRAVNIDNIKTNNNLNRGEVYNESVRSAKLESVENVESNNMRGDEIKSGSEDSCSCVHGGACVHGVCLCPLGYAGDNCQITLDLKVPRFNGSSYLRLPGLGHSALSWLDIQITLKATSGTGLVLYNPDRASGAGDFFSLQLRDYYVEFAFDLGSGIALVRGAIPLQPFVWYRVAVSRNGKRAQLRVWPADAEGLTSGATRSVTSRGASTQLELRQPLMLGGAPQPLPARLALAESFSGCIRQLIINEEEMSVVASALGGVNVDNCEEPKNNVSCSQSQGNCKTSLETVPDSSQNYSSNDIHHSIVPKKGFKMKHLKTKPKKKSHAHSERYILKKYLKLKKNQYHRTMERSNEIVTGEPNEPNYQNMYNDETYMQVKYMDTNEINWSDGNSYPSFTGKDSFIHIDDSETMKRLLSYTLDINIRFKSVTSNGLLVWSGRNNMQPGDDFLSLAIENSMLVFRYDLGSGEVVIIANHTVDDGLWHRARATRNRQAGVLEVDGLGSVGKVSPGKLKQLNTENGLYIGGLPSISSNTLGKYASGIEGCISQISLSGDFDIPLSLNKLPHTITNNVGRCLP